MTHYNFHIAESATFALLDPGTNAYIKMSIVNGSDGSGYLVLNSGNPNAPDYIKISYHPRDRELVYAFTNEYWRGQKKANRERRIICEKVSESSNQILVSVYIDKGALFRVDTDKWNYQQVLFPDEGAIEVIFSLENAHVVVDIKGIHAQERITDFILKSQSDVCAALPTLDKKITGCVQAVLCGDGLPLKIVLFGI